MRRLAGARELMDGPLDPRTLVANLRDLARVNRWLGGVELSWRALEPILQQAPVERPLRMLDVGTGAADLPIALTQRARKSGLRIEIVATDVRQEIVELAAKRVAEAGIQSVEVRLASPDRIEAQDGSFDVVHTSLVLHHLEPQTAVTLMREMGRVANRALIVNDLDRSRLWWAGAWLLARITTANPYTRHDAPLSVRRAYRPNEMTRLGALAGLVEVTRYRARPGYRYAIVLARDTAPND